MSKRNSHAAKARRRAERQQQRNRQERAGREAAPAARRPHVLEVQLTRVHFPQDDLGEEYTGWAATWSLQDDSVGTEDSNENLRQLVDDIIDDARRWTDRHDLTIEWDISGDTPSGKTVQELVAEAGVTLPTTIHPRGNADGPGE